MARKDIAHVLDTDFPGRFEFIYVDKTNIHIVYFDEEGSTVYVVTLNKYYEIDYVEEVKNSKDLFEARDFVFTRPQPDNDGGVVFKGFLQNGRNEWSRFEIKNSSLYLTPQHATKDFVQDNSILQSIKDADRFEFDFYIQKKNKVYFVGWDLEANESVFAIYDLESDSIQHLNSFYSDNEEFYLRSIAFENESRSIFLCGYKEDLKTKERKAYFTFMQDPVH